MLHPGGAASAIGYNIQATTGRTNHISDKDVVPSILAKLLWFSQHHGTKSEPPVTGCNFVDFSRSLHLSFALELS